MKIRLELMEQQVEQLRRQRIEQLCLELQKQKREEAVERIQF